MNYVLIALFGYILNAGSTIIDKFLLDRSIPNPIVYVFFINILGLLAVLLIPFGVKFDFAPVFLSSISGWAFVFAVYFYFKALRVGEASVVLPIVGSLNPFFSLLLGSIFLQQIFTQKQYLAFFIILIGTIVLTFNLWVSKVKFDTQFISMVLSGFGFAISYLALREGYNLSNFITGLTFNRLGASVLVLCFLAFPSLKKQIFQSKVQTNKFANNTTTLLGLGQIMGGLSGLLINFAVSLANPALVNSLFGAQYLVILVAAFFFPKLLEEKMSVKVIFQKILGAAILSTGVYLLAI